jgi:hypothetical protein
MGPAHTDHQGGATSTSLEHTDFIVLFHGLLLMYHLPNTTV